MVLTTLASAALGLFGSVLPELTAYAKNKAERNHELDVLKFQASSETAQSLAAKQTAEVIALKEEMKAIYTNAHTTARHGWVDLFYKLTRPGITWIVVAQWMLVNCAEMVWMVKNNSDWTAVTQAWSEFDQATMTAVVMFWFGHRAMMRTNGRSVDR